MEAAEVGTDGVIRCRWGNGSAEYAAYHDEEWGRPAGDDRRLFEKLCLEGEVFEGFDIQRVAHFDDSDVERMLGDARIVRHEGKIRSTINNAQRSLAVIDEVGSLGALIWPFEPPPGRPTDAATTPESVTIARELKRRGFTFVGPTTAYAFMQSMGLVNDHAEACAVREAVEAERTRFVRPG
jgi:DNA-3-methyladenine glycosylase I